MLVATEFKDKIGKNLAYPAGAELISQAIEGIVQADKTSIGFRSRHTMWASQCNQILRAGSDYLLLECAMHHDRISAPEVIISWHIVVYPVLREFKAAARAALVAEGLPLLKNYLLETGPPNSKNWYPLRLRFSPDEKRIY